MVFFKYRKKINKIFTLFGVLLISLSTVAQKNLPTVDEEQVAMVMQIPFNKGTTTFTTEVMGEVSLQDVNKILIERSLLRDIVVASDSDAVVSLTANQIKKSTLVSNGLKQIRILPLGRLTETAASARQEYKSYLGRAQETLRSDKVTVILLTVTTALDTVVWMQATSLEFPQKLSMLALNVLMGVTFGLDRDLWGKFTTPLQNKIIGALDMLSGSIDGQTNRGKMLTAQFMSNFILGSSLFFIRQSLLSFHNIHATLGSASFITHSLKLTAAATLTQFAWSELYNGIDNKANPVAKLNLKRLADVRYVILTLFASSSMVMQPDVYGQTPMVTYFIHGSLGILALLSAEKLVAFLENNKFSKRIYKHTAEAEKFMDALLEPFENLKPEAEIMFCAALF